MALCGKLDFELLVQCPSQYQNVYFTTIHHAMSPGEFLKLLHVNPTTRVIYVRQWHATHAKILPKSLLYCSYDRQWHATHAKILPNSLLYCS